MDRPSYKNATEVSAYWTPQHLDVTDLPMRYAPPKAAWIDGFNKLRPLAKIDARDRMARRRVQTHAVVDPVEIIPLPPLPRPVRDDFAREPGWLEELRAMSRLVTLRRRAS